MWHSVLYRESGLFVIVLSMFIGANFTFFNALEIIILNQFTQAFMLFVVERVEQVLHQVVTFWTILLVGTLSKCFI
jgi:hypothetical protein